MSGNRRSSSCSSCSRCCRSSASRSRAYLLGTARRAAVMDEQLARARRHQVGVSVLAGAAALVTMPLGAALTPWLGQSTVLPVLPSLMVVAACVVLWVGEVTFPRPTGLVRSTVLNPRGLPAWCRAGGCGCASGWRPSTCCSSPPVR